MKKILTENWTLVLYFFLSIFAVLPFFSSGFFTFHDDTQVARMYEMAKALSDGMFPVRWVQDLGYGFGYPIFNFYSVLPYYIGGLLHTLGVDLLFATKITFVAGIIGAGVSMYFLVKSFYGRLAGLVAAIIYLYFPYHAINIYVRGDLAELFAYAFLPLMFLSLFKIHSQAKKVKSYIALGAISIAAVVISHNLSAFMLFIFIGLFILASLALSRERKKLFIAYTTTLVIAFLLSAFYSIPALFEMKYTNVLSVLGGGSDWRDHFVCLPQLWDSLWGFGGSAQGCIDGLSFKLGKSNVILGIIAAILILFNLKKVREHRFNIFAILGFLIFSIFMTLEISSIFWSLPFMDFLQFPWRFLNFVGIFLSLLAGSFVWILSKQYSERGALLVSIFIIIVTLVLNAKLFAPQKIMDVDSSYYTSRDYLNFTVSKISDEYMPKNFVRPADKYEISQGKIIVINVPQIVQSKIETQNIWGKIDAQEATYVRFDIAHFPAWHFFLDGQEIPSEKVNRGYVIVVPRGQHTIEARFIETEIERVGNILTLIGVMAVSLVIIGKPTFLYGKKTS